jgi:hypothetical protein
MHPPVTHLTSTPPRTLAALGLGALFLLGACATTPPEPTLAMQAAKQAIATADRARIADQASPELHEARDKLAAAQDAIQEKRMVQAERLAQESRVDAELASATIDTAKAKAVNDDMVRSAATLHQEMQREPGVTQ